LSNAGSATGSKADYQKQNKRQCTMIWEVSQIHVV